MTTTTEMLLYWQTFGDSRFTKNDLWRAFGNGGWPTPGFVESLGLEKLDWLEQAPGPRGGAGWKITAAAAEGLRKQEQRKAAQQEATENTLARVAVSLGALRVQPSYRQDRKDRIVWSYWPPVAIEGRNVNGSKRDPQAAFTLSLPSDLKSDLVQREVDGAVNRVRQLASEQKERLVKQIEALDQLAGSAADGCPGSKVDNTEQ